MIHRLLVLLPLSLLALLPAAPAGAASATLVADIDPGVSVPDFGDDWGPSSTMIRLGERVLFVADEPGTGSELWVTDGTPTGTRILRDACPGPCDDGFALLGASEEAAFYALQSRGGSRSEILRTDGTRSGTFLVATPNAASLAGGDLRVVGSMLFSVVCDIFGDEPCRLWASDGTPAAAELLLELPDASEIGSLMPAGDRLFFVVQSGVDLELWVSDGTAAGTRPVRRIPGTPRVGPRLTVVVGPRLFFIVGDELGSGQLWASDGTAAGTLALTSFAAPRPFEPTTHLRALDGAVYFVVDDVVGGIDLWVSDGTVAGTRRVTDFGFARPFDGAMVASRLEKVGGKLVFVATDGLTGQRLWTSGGTPATTAPVAGCAGGCPEVEGPLAKAGGRVVFTGADAARGLEPWSSDGTGAGTARLRDVCPGACDSQPAVAAALGAVWIAARTAELSGDVALLRSDGTPAGTREVARLSRDGFDHISGGSFRDLSGFRPVPVGGRIAFVAWDPERGAQLWTSDGTAAGTGPVTLLAAGGRSSAPRALARLGQEILFFACRLEEDGEIGFLRLRLWASGGTGVRRLPWSGSCRETPLVAQAGGLVYFAERESASTWQLWRTDGTDAGTVLLASLPEALYLELAAVGTKAVVLASDNDRAEVWASDGTPQGTARVRQMPPDVRKPLQRSLAGLGAQAYFVTTDPRHEAQVWVTDGTPGGTLQITTLDSYSAPDDPEFTGTWLVQDVAPGGLSSQPGGLTVAGGHLFFAADDGVLGRELWALPLAGAPACQPSDTALCLNGGRFRVEATWRDFAGNAGRGHARVLTADTGYFWFFNEANVEVILKVLDGRGVNEHHWAFYGALSNVEYTLTVTDTATGASRRYINPPGRFGSVGDTEAFGPRGARAGEASVGPAAEASSTLVLRETRQVEKAGPCVAGPRRLCLNGGRFAVEARWRDFAGNTGEGTAVALTADTGWFWFFDDDNVEAVVKVLDGRPVNGKFWLFYGALSNVEYTLTVTDTATGAERTYANPRGRFASVGDTDAF